MNLSAQTEAVLFFKAEPVSVKRLATILKVGETEIQTALAELEKTLENMGISLIRNADEVELRTAPGVSSLIETLTKEELARDLGKAGLETIAASTDLPGGSAEIGAR